MDWNSRRTLQWTIILWALFVWAAGSWLIITPPPATTPWPVMSPVPSATATATVTATPTCTPRPVPTLTPTLAPTPTPEAWQFAVLADMQVAETWCRSLDISELAKMDLILIPGDLVDHGHAGFAIFERCYGPILDRVLPAPGNHDVHLDRVPYDNFARARLVGRNILLRGPREYVVLHRNVAVVSLSWFGTRAAWVEEALRVAQVADHIVVILHRPVFSTYWSEASAVHAPLFTQYGVDFVFTGHVHAYDRIKRDGVIYITTGGAGGKLYQGQRHHYVLITVSPLSAEIRYLQ